MISVYISVNPLPSRLSDINRRGRKILRTSCCGYAQGYSTLYIHTTVLMHTELTETQVEIKDLHSYRSESILWLRGRCGYVVLFLNKKSFVIGRHRWREIFFNGVSESSINHALRQLSIEKYMANTKQAWAIDGFLFFLFFVFAFFASLICCLFLFSFLRVSVCLCIYVFLCVCMCVSIEKGKERERI